MFDAHCFRRMLARAKMFSFILGRLQTLRGLPFAPPECQHVLFSDRHFWPHDSGEGKRVSSKRGCKYETSSEGGAPKRNKTVSETETWGDDNVYDPVLQVLLWPVPKENTI